MMSSITQLFATFSKWSQPLSPSIIPVYSTERTYQTNLSHDFPHVTTSCEVPCHFSTWNISTQPLRPN